MEIQHNPHHGLSPKNLSLDLRITSLRPALLDDVISLRHVIDHVYARIEAYRDHHVWIHVVPKEVTLAKVEALSRAPNRHGLPLFGIPFAVKDNIDVAGIPTTAGCETFGYTPQESAHVVKKLEDAGAILIGKTNLDQFATGLVGTRSPYGVVRNSVDPSYISGGSSSGSAVAVALGMVSFSLGTDTAGSGRVPAGFNNLFGLKPTRNLISTTGVVPACKTLDCVSIFALSAEDASVLLDIAASPVMHYYSTLSSFTYAIPRKEDLHFSGNHQYESLYHQALQKLDAAGGKRVEVNFTAFQQTADLLYGGPWVAERLAAIGDFFETNAEDMLPETRTIIGKGKQFTAIDTFRALYKLEELKTQAMQVMKGVDLLVVPTTPTIYTIEEVKAEPFTLNANLGYYTNFVNLLDLCALAVPNGFQSNGLPMGVTLIATPHNERKLLQLGKLFTR